MKVEEIEIKGWIQRLWLLETKEDYEFLNEINEEIRRYIK